MRQKRKLLLFLACLAVLMGIGIGKISIYAETKGTMILEKGTKGSLWDMISNAYDYTSSNNKVVSVDSYGKVYAKKAGSATITSSTGYSFCEPVRVKVIDKKIAFKNTTITTAPDPESLEKKLKFNVGTVKTYVEYNNLVCVCSKVPFTSIQSSNDAVIGVGRSIQWNDKYGYSELRFEIKGPGTTTITAKVGNKAMKCKVTVIDPKLNETEVCKIVGNKTTLKVNGVKGKVKWKSENPAIATVDSNGVVTAKDLGTTYIDATVKGVTLRCKFTTEPVPQFVNIYTMKGINKVVLADTVLRTSAANKFDTTINDEGKTETTYNWDVIGDITDVDYSNGMTYPVYDIENGSSTINTSDYYTTEIYLAGSSQNAVITKLDSTIDGGTDFYYEYEPGEGMGTIRIYSRDSSPALYQVKIDGHKLVFATRCREYGETKPTDKRAQSTETATYVRQNISAFNVDISDAMISVGKYIIDKTIETAVGAIVDKFFPW